MLITAAVHIHMVNVDYIDRLLLLRGSVGVVVTNERENVENFSFDGYIVQCKPMGIDSWRGLHETCQISFSILESLLCFGLYIWGTVSRHLNLIKMSTYLQHPE